MADFFFFFYLLNEAAPAVQRRPRPCIFPLCMCQEQDSGEQGEGRKGWEVRRPFTALGECSLAWSWTLPSPWGNKLHTLTSQVNKLNPTVHTWPHNHLFPSVLSTPSPLIGPNFLPGRVLRLNSTRVGQRSEVENHQLDLLRGGEKSRTRRSFFFYQNGVCSEHD